MTELGTAEKKALGAAFWLLFTGGLLGMIVGFAWFISGKRPFAQYATAGIGGAVTMALSALISFARNHA